MVIVYPDPLYPSYPDPLNPYPIYPDPYPLDFTGNYTIETIKEVEKKWKERHVKDVKKGILITFKDGEEPVFIATDDDCWSKIMEAVKDEPRKNHK